MAKEETKELGEEGKAAKARAQRIPTKEYVLLKANGPKKKGDKIMLNDSSAEIFRKKELIK